MNFLWEPGLHSVWYCLDSQAWPQCHLWTQSRGSCASGAPELWGPFCCVRPANMEVALTQSASALTKIHGGFVPFSWGALSNHLAPAGGRPHATRSSGTVMMSLSLGLIVRVGFQERNLVSGMLLLTVPIFLSQDYMRLISGMCQHSDLGDAYSC